MKPIKKYFNIYLFINILLRNTFEIICDKKQNCSECSLCGKNNNDYCSCSFDNSFCKNEENDITFISDFLFSYDGCQKPNSEFYDICGASDINLEFNVKNSIKFSSQNSKDILCYYNIINNNINNILNINIRKENGNFVDLSIFLVYYLNNGNIQISSILNINGKTDFNYNLTESYVEKISLYVSIQDALNIGDVSIDFYLEANSITKISKKISSNKIITIIFIILSSIFGVAILIIIILIFRKNRFKKRTKVTTHKNKGLSYLEIEKRNIAIINYLFNNELAPKIFNTKDAINDSYKCTICLENFVEGISCVTTTKCGHKFHFICFKRWVEKNIITPKCPNCNKPIIREEDMIIPSNLGTTNPSILFRSNSQITQTTNITMNKTSIPMDTGVSN